MESPGGFVVFEGSSGRLEPDASFWRAARRYNLMAMGQIVVEDGRMALAEDCEFSSASEAAIVMAGTDADGARAWKPPTGRR